MPARAPAAAAGAGAAAAGVGAAAGAGVGAGAGAAAGLPEEAQAARPSAATTLKVLEIALMGREVGVKWRKR